MLDKNDEKTIHSILFDGLNHLVETVIVPQFKEVKNEIGGLKENVGELKIMSEVLDRDMTGIKMRLSEVEKKVETLIDNSIEVKFIERRVTKLEAATK